MSLKKYKAFCSVVELGSFSKAAQQLGCSQSAVSHMLNDLEKACGYPLLVRGSRKIVLTTEGAALLPFIKKVVEADELVEKTASGLKSLDLGMIRIGAFTSVAVHWLPDIIKGFQKQNPNIQFSLKNGDYHDIEQWLQNDEIDVGFITLPSDVECRQIKLTEDPLLVVLSTNHPYALKATFPITQVSNEDFIGLLETSSHDTKRIFAENHITPNIKFTTKDDYAIIAMVEKGLGISILPELLLSGRTQHVVTKELYPKCKRTIGLAVSSGATESPLVNSFCDYVQHWVAQLKE